MSWKEAQAAQYEYSDEEEYSDDDYEPINVASWGNQTVTDEGTTQIDIGWDSLIDPSVKIKAGGIGSGQLHRKGANFKPLDEQFILNQRLGKPIPKAIGGGKKKGKKPKGPPPARRPPPPSMKPPSFSMHRSRAPVTPGQGPWGSGELASTPFWEQPTSAIPGTNASKYATPAPAAAPLRQQPPPPQQQKQQYQQYQQYQQPPVASAAPSRQPEPVKPITSSLLGSGASKYATSAPAQQQYQQYQQPQQPQQPQYQQYQQPAQPPTQPPTQPHAQQRQPSEVTHRFDLPCLNFNIEMAPGINAKLSVYSDDDPVKVVDRFERDHNLIMSDEQKSRFADKVARLLMEYR